MSGAGGRRVVELSPESRRLVAAVTGGLVPTVAHVEGPDGLPLRCLVWGGDAGRTVVLIHGNGGHAHWWDPVVPALVPGWRVVVPDVRGHGESGWPPEPRYRVQDFAADLDAVLAALAPPPIALVGHSMGGRVTAWYASEHPEAVTHLGLLDTRMDRIRAEYAAKHRGRVDAGKREGTRAYPTYADAVAAFRFVPKEPDVPPAVVADLAHHAVCERGPGDWGFRFDRAVLALEGDGADDLADRLGRIACPTWLAAGADSWVLYAEQRTRMADRLARCTVEVFPGGHHFLVAHGEATGRALRRFLDGAPVV